MATATFRVDGTESYRELVQNEIFQKTFLETSRPIRVELASLCDVMMFEQFSVVLF